MEALTIDILLLMIFVVITAWISSIGVIGILGIILACYGTTVINALMLERDMVFLEKFYPDIDPKWNWWALFIIYLILVYAFYGVLEKSFANSLLLRFTSVLLGIFSGFAVVLVIKEILVTNNLIHIKDESSYALKSINYITNKVGLNNQCLDNFKDKFKFDNNDNKR